MIVNGLKFNCLARWSLTKAVNNTKESWADIEKAMEGNTSVTDIYMGPYFYSDLTAAELAAFLERCARYLTNLKVLSIGTLEFTKTPIEGASALGSFLSTARNLCTLRIERNLLLRSPSDVKTLASGFVNHPSLQRISLPSIHPSWLLQEEEHEDVVDDSNSTYYYLIKNISNKPGRLNSITEGGVNECHKMRSLDPLIYAFASISNLLSLQLGLSDSASECLQKMNRVDRVSSPVAFSQLATLPRLSWLVVCRFHIKDAHIQTLCQSLQPQRARNGSNGEVWDITPRTIAPIKVFDFAKNSHVTARSWRAMLELLQTHVYLEGLDMVCRPDDRPAQRYKQHVNLFLKLNREGRRRKLRELQGDKETWVDTVGRYFRNDLTALNVLLRESPWICIPSGIVKKHNAAEEEEEEMTTLMSISSASCSSSDSMFEI